jgi:hypothetical protein
LCKIFPRNATKQTIVMAEEVAANFSALCQYDPNFLDEPFATFLLTINTLANHFMFHVMDEVVTQIIPFGIPLHWYHFHTWNRFVKKTRARMVEELESFKLCDWSFGFIIWGIACGISTIVFIMEMMMWPRVKAKWAEKWSLGDETMRRKEVRKTRIILVSPAPDVWSEIERTLDCEIWEVKN